MGKDLRNTFRAKVMDVGSWTLSQVQDTCLRGPPPEHIVFEQIEILLRSISKGARQGYDPGLDVQYLL